MDWKDIAINSSIKPNLADNARVVLEKRYLIKDEKGNVIETAEDLFRRVAMVAASADFAYGAGRDDVGAVATKFYEMMAELKFMPNSPTLMNAGRPLGQLSACFVLPVEDSMEKIFETLKDMALIHKSGGGTGFSFSRLRPKNDLVKSTAGISSGPVSFMNIFNAATETVKQGGTRRGANMAILRVDHPDIVDFIRAKENKTSLTNFNISVALTDEFMSCLEQDGEFRLKNPRTGEPAGSVNARELFDLIIEKAWLNGEPGIVFIDEINRHNSLKKTGLIESTNPCGEQPLLAYESCNLGSINLGRFVKETEAGYAVDYDLLSDAVATSVHFLDNIIDVNRYPLDEIAKITRANRKIGLGVMGFADLLIRLGIPYNSEQAISAAEEVMSFIQNESKKASQKLAASRGAFPNFGSSDFADRGEQPLRNATTTTIAPTGTISIITGSSSGIEPLFALAFVRNVMDNNRLLEINPFFESLAHEKGFYSDDVMKRVAEKGSVSGIDEVPSEVRNVFVSAHDIEPEWHIKIQAAFQKYVDNAVSKTVNFPHSATIEDIEQCYTMAHRLGCKGVTVYRDGSRDDQVLQKKGDEKKTQTEIPSSISPRPRDEITWGTTRKMTTGCGSLYVTINEDRNGLFEVFATMGKGGGCAASQTEAVSRLISLSLRSGIDREQIIKQLKGVRCPNQAWEKGGRIYSCADAIAKALERHSNVDSVMHEADPVNQAKDRAETNGKGSDTVMVGVCPECHGPLEFEGGCSVCRSCGFSRCG
ncbi:MAG TPA: vitamin B12-dependent ribonucleotide reductase [Spirochaetota bacterium]|nr:vitamin B12-dependent ribonucleotide reductase [Spirochaetota bacterium]HPI88883.1 vitamin B12-dependent ribonucleotide reductase [Spirochaetota bacterium]HPR46987.1 vitamin B12-dependent ribonucleotide reductase [Spirochaetota bacterium]